jgi:hypothetical protein
MTIPKRGLIRGTLPSVTNSPRATACVGHGADRGLVEVAVTRCGPKRHRVLNGTPIADVPVAPDDDLRAASVLVTGPRRHQLADQANPLHAGAPLSRASRPAPQAPQGAEERKRRGSISRRPRCRTSVGVAHRQCDDQAAIWWSSTTLWPPEWEEQIRAESVETDDGNFVIRGEGRRFTPVTV